MKDNKNKIFTIIALITIILTLIGTSYAFFAAQGNTVASVSSTVTSNTTDLLTFSISDDIEFEASQFDFEENYGNKSGESTVTAILTPNNKTGASTMYYNLYFNSYLNEFEYSLENTNEDPELLLQVFNSNNELVTLTGLGGQVTVKGLTGYDITGLSGLKTIFSHHAISASNNTTTTEEWRVVVTFINLDIEQYENTGKKFIANIIVSQEEFTECDINPNSCLNLTVNNLANEVVNSVDFTCNGVTAEWNNKLSQLEISAVGRTNNCSMSYSNPTGTTPLNSYVTGLSGSTQGNGKLIKETFSGGNIANGTVVKTFGTTPEYFRNTSSVSTTKTETGAFWTFDSSTGVFTSDPSTMTTSGATAYYHVYAKVPSAGYYQICFSIDKAPDSRNQFVVTVDGEYWYTISNTIFDDGLSACVYITYFSSSKYIQVSERAYSGTDSPVITFTVEKLPGKTYNTGYRYEGKDPNNYIMFNNELWRIMGVFETEYDSDNDGTIDTTGNLVKIIRNYSLASLDWDKNEGTNWSDSTLYNLLNKQYYDWDTYESSMSDYCYAYDDTPTNCDYSVKGIQDEYRSMIPTVKWYAAGGLDNTDTTFISYYYHDELYLAERNIKNYVYAKNSTVNAHVGLMYSSDAIYGVLDSDCSRNNLHYNSSEVADCVSNNWVFGVGEEWTMSCIPDNDYNVWGMYRGQLKRFPSYYGFNIRPVVYLNPSVYKISGTGTPTDPYIIGM